MKKGRRFQAHGLRCVVLRNSHEHARIGFAISRKYGNAAQRHAIKRAFRESFRCHCVKSQSVDILIISNRPFDAASNLHQDAIDLLNQLTSKYRHYL